MAILDALSACEFPIIEVHISNIHRREAFRHHSYVSKAASGVIAGFGTQGYLFALQRMAQLLGAAPEYTALAAAPARTATPAAAALRPVLAGMCCGATGARAGTAPRAGGYECS